MQEHEIELFDNTYPALYTFLSAGFPDHDGMPDEEIVAEYLNENPDEKAGIVAEGRQLLGGEDPLQDGIGYLANRYFESRAEAARWLAGVLDMVAQASG
jgi:hypothetical protein